MLWVSIRSITIMSLTLTEPSQSGLLKISHLQLSRHLLKQDKTSQETSVLGTLQWRQQEPVSWRTLALMSLFQSKVSHSLDTIAQYHGRIRSCWSNAKLVFRIQFSIRSSSTSLNLRSNVINLLWIPVGSCSMSTLIWTCLRDLAIISLLRSYIWRRLLIAIAQSHSMMTRR